MKKDDPLAGGPTSHILPGKSPLFVSGPTVSKSNNKRCCNVPFSIERKQDGKAQFRTNVRVVLFNRWRANALTYKGFTPKKVASNGDVSYAYDETDNKTIYVPKGSDSTNFHYKITLVDATTGSTLAPASTGYSTAGSSWRLLAEPSTSLESSNAQILMISSRGVKCKSKDRTVTTASTTCGTYSEEW